MKKITVCLIVLFSLLNITPTLATGYRHYLRIDNNCNYPIILADISAKHPSHISHQERIMSASTLIYPGASSNFNNQTFIMDATDGHYTDDLYKEKN